MEKQTYHNYVQNYQVADYNKLRNESAELERKRSALQPEYTAALSYIKNFPALNTSFAKVSEENRTLENEHSNLKNRCHCLEIDLVKKKSAQESLQTEVNKMEAEHALVLENFKNSDNLLQSCQTELATEQEKGKQQEREIQELAAIIDGLNVGILQLNEQHKKVVSNHSLELISLSNKLHELTLINAKLVNNIANKDTESSGVSSGSESD
jgi:chromosome segregation ATPase